MQSYICYDLWVTRVTSVTCKYCAMYNDVFEKARQQNPLTPAEWILNNFLHVYSLIWYSTLYPFKFHQGFFNHKNKCRSTFYSDIPPSLFNLEILTFFFHRNIELWAGKKVKVTQFFLFLFLSLSPSRC